MDAGQFWALLVFSLVGSFTPGPNVAIATATGANFGFRATLPLIVGVPVGFTTMLAFASLGVLGVLVALPAAAGVIKWGGIAYLLYLGWLLARPGHAPPDGARSIGLRPLTFLESALFQYANPKAWMLTVATAGTYVSGRGVAVRTAVICAVFAATCVASLVLWAWLGAAMREWLDVGRRRWCFNAAMGLSLVATAVWMAVTT